MKFFDSSVRGYAVVWDHVSLDIATRGPSRYECVPRGALTVAQNLIFDQGHCGINAFAFCHDQSGRAWSDGYGLAFEATLPLTFGGANVHNALREGLRLGVSVQMGALEYEPNLRNGVHVLRRAEVSAISIMGIGRALYPQACCWLSSGGPDHLAPDVEDARRRWSAPSQAHTQQAKSARAKPLFNLALFSQLPAPRRRAA
jgi:hypothetical protein